MQKLYEYFLAHKGLILGILVGLIIAVLFITIGFWRTLLLGICVLAGIFIGTYKERTGRSFLEFLDRILPTGLR